MTLMRTLVAVSALLAGSPTLAQEITVWADATRQPAVEAFQAAHPEIKVNLVVDDGSSGASGTFQTKIGLADQAIHVIVPGAPQLDLLYSYPAVVIGLVHSYLPYMILTCYISLQAIDDSVIEAARSLGARSGALFRRAVNSSAPIDTRMMMVEIALISGVKPLRIAP